MNKRSLRKCLWISGLLLGVVFQNQGCSSPFSATQNLSSLGSQGGGAPTLPLSVEAGSDAELIMPNRSVQLAPTVTGALVSALWTQTSGPGAVTFTDPSSAQTFATFPAPGAYELQLTVTGTSEVKSDTVRVRITAVPSGPDFVLQADNQGSWKPGVDVGVDGGINQYLAGGARDRAVTGRVLNMVTDFGADPTGVVDVKSAVVAALSAAVTGDVLYFPAGTFLFKGGFIYSGYKDNITIRGAGPRATLFRLSTTQPIFIFNDPGTPNGTYSQEVTGAKTKGTSVLTVADATGYEVGRRALITYENEDDSARITSGANPVWTSAGFPNIRSNLVIVKEVTATTIKIDPPLVTDSTYLKTHIGTHPGGIQGSDGWGFEDFSVSFDSANHPSRFASIGASTGTWFYNIHFKDFSRRSSNGSCIGMGLCYKCEIRKNRFTALPGSSSDGAIETGANSSIVIADNIFEGDFGTSIYDSGNSSHNLIAYNYSKDSMLSIFHNAHPSLNLIEGNVGPSHQSDGYHGSSSNNTIYRNWFYSPFGVILNRFKRDYVIAGNVFGHDGVTSYGGISFGNPNMGNGAADGFAGPMGTSTRVGSIDYSQPGYGFNTYVIQARDVSAGDFWQDWNVTGTLINRFSDTEGLFMMSGGKWFVGASATGAAQIYTTVHWNNKVERMSLGSVISVSGYSVRISFPSGRLPAAGTAFTVYFGPAGWQERDLDVEASTLVTHNYGSKANGGGAVQSPTASRLPASLAYTVRPSWWNDDGFTGIWPPIDPNAAVFSPSIIPAGARYLASP